MNFLRQERERLGLNGREVYEKIGVSKGTYIRWEGGHAIPSDMLSSLCEIGFDISFVVTGKRTQSEIKLDRPSLGDRDRLAIAIELVMEGLEQAGRYLPPHKFSELVLAAYDLMADPVQTRDNIIQLVRRVA